MKNTILLKVKFNESLLSLRRNHFNSRIKHANNIAEILLQVALNTNQSINQSINKTFRLNNINNDGKKP
jgi:hypothetical protein